MPDLFQALTWSILGQQISTKACEAVWSRMLAGLGEVTPGRVMEESVASLQKFGTSFRKAGYIHSIAEQIVTGAFARRGLMAHLRSRAHRAAVPPHFTSIKFGEKREYWRNCITFAIQIQKIMEAGITKPNKQSVSFRWSPELVEKFKKIARQQNRSFSNFTETILSRAVSIMDQAEEDVPNATTAAAINEAKEHRKKHKAGLSGDSSIDTSSVDAMIRTTLR